MPEEQKSSYLISQNSLEIVYPFIESINMIKFREPFRTLDFIFFQYTRNKEEKKSKKFGESVILTAGK